MSEEYASVTELVEDEITTAVGEDCELPNGKKIRIRGMSRWELQQMGKGTEDPSVVEARMLSYCIIQPKMTEAQVTAMQKGKPPQWLAAPMGRIRTLSGLDDGAAKSGVDEVRD